MNAKKIILWILVIFALYAIIIQPDTCSAAVHDTFIGIAHAGGSVARFFDGILQGH
jgi:uncharacterized MnhB-related membrane protein